MACAAHRFSYCALNCLRLIGRMDGEPIAPDGSQTHVSACVWLGVQGNTGWRGMNTLNCPTRGHREQCVPHFSLPIPFAMKRITGVYKRQLATARLAACAAARRFGQAVPLPSRPRPTQIKGAA